MYWSFKYFIPEKYHILKMTLFILRLHRSITEHWITYCWFVYSLETCLTVLQTGKSEGSSPLFSPQFTVLLETVVKYIVSAFSLVWQRRVNLFPEILESLEVQVLFKIIIKSFLLWIHDDVIVLYFMSHFLKNILQEQKKKEKLEKKKRSLKVVEVIVTSQNFLLWCWGLNPGCWICEENDLPLKDTVLLNIYAILSFEKITCAYSYLLNFKFYFLFLFFLKDFIFTLYVCVCFAYMCVSTSCVWSALGSPMWMSDLLELELFSLFICLL